MTLYDRIMGQDDHDHIRYTSTGLVPGMIVVGLGVLFLLNNLHIVTVRNWWALWPVVLIAVGLTKLVDSPRHGDRTGGIVMVTIGGVFLANNLGWLSWEVWEWWPLLLIAAGLFMLLNRTGAGLMAGIRLRPQGAPKADAIAVFGGFKRQVSTEDYRGASYVAIFGGGEIDLRRAQIQADSAVIDIQAIFGGFELKVPTNWLVVNEVVGIFGGTGDETLQPSPDMPGVRKLIVRGSAIFGGVGIKN
jgi:Domain of unknown function (DUF5668)/Cell wall-active antibiotics response 4TMS YvqF